MGRIDDSSSVANEQEGPGMGPEVWVPIVTLVIGAILGSVGQWIGDARSHQHEMAHSRAAWIRERMVDLLIALEELSRLSRYARNKKAQRAIESGVWEWTSEDNQFLIFELPAAQTKCTTLILLIADPKLRFESERTVAELGNVMIARNEEEADVLYNKALLLYDQTILHLGAYARSL